MSQFTKFVIALAVSATTSWNVAVADDKADLPDCDDANVRKVAAEAVEDFYAKIGGAEKEYRPISDIIRSRLVAAPRSANILVKERAMARSLGFDGAEHARICLAEIFSDNRIVAFIVTDPNDHDNWIIAVTNIGLGDRGAESLPQPK